MLVDWKQRGLDRETHQDPDRDRYTSDEEGTVVDNAADELELIAVLKRPTRLLPHGTVVRTNLEPSIQEATPLVPFGLCNATATFQRLMAQALTSVTKKYGNLIMCYVDDVVIATPTLEDQIERLDEVFTCMKQAGLKCKPSKCEILR